MSSPNTDEVSGSRRYGLELGIGMVDIFVGPAEQRFQVHQHLLCTYVPVFDKMFNGNFKEATEQSAKLPEDDCDAFHLFVEWLYSRRLAFPNTNIPKDSALSVPLKLYCFAEKYCLTELMDFTASYILAICRARNWLPSVDHIQYVYDHTAAGSMLRKLMSQTLRYVALELSNTSSWPTIELGRLMFTNEDLAVDVFTLLRGPDGKAPQNPKLVNPCEYHIHGKSKKCSVAKDAFPISK